jgi:predicted nucleic acid-binding protein
MAGVLTDTTVLSNFAHSQQPHLLRRVFPSLAVPEEVMAELAEGERAGLVPSADWSWLEVLGLSPAESRIARDLRRVLGSGESACLSLASARGYVLLTDDRDARRVARSMGVAVSGTVGTLLKMVQHSVLTLERADEVLAEMRRCGYRSPVESLQSLLGP